MPTTEDLLREVLSNQAVFGERLENFSEQLTTTTQEARQAREQAARAIVILEEHDHAARLAEHKAENRAALADIRQDFVAANGRVRTELEAALARVASLEAERQRQEGAKGLIAWLMKNAPWLLAGIAAFAAGLGFKGKIG